MIQWQQSVYMPVNVKLKDKADYMVCLVDRSTNCISTGGTLVLQTCVHECRTKQKLMSENPNTSLLAKIK